MTKEDLKAELKAIEKKAELEKIETYKKYANANSPYKIGDVVSAHIGALKIEKIAMYIAYGESQCTFTGVELKKDLTPVKKQSGRTVFRDNIID